VDPVWSVSSTALRPDVEGCTRLVPLDDEHKDVFCREESLLSSAMLIQLVSLQPPAGPLGVRGLIMHSHSSCTS
jgi:hypothetical protein